MRRRYLAVCALAAVALVSGLAAVGWWRARVEPAWWAAAGVLAADAERRAVALENGAVTALHAPRPDGAPWSVEVTEADANAWLALRFARWATNRGHAWPPRGDAADAWSQPRLRLTGGRVRVAVRAPVAGSSRIVGASFVPAVRDSGGGAGLVLGAPALVLGALELSATAAGSARVWAAERLASLLGDAARAEAVMRGDDALVPDAALRLDDGRTVRLVGLEVREGSLVATFVTERAPGGRGAADRGGGGGPG